MNQRIGIFFNNLMSKVKDFRQSLPEIVANEAKSSYETKSSTRATSV